MMASETLARARSRPDETVSHDLQDTLLELLHLALDGKQAHWNVSGPLFRPVHHELDEIVDVARWAADEVAERLATLGTPPDGRASTIVANRSSESLPSGRLDSERAVDLIGGELEELTDRLHRRIDDLDGVDLVSQGVLIQVAERLEKQAWMLRAQRA